MNCPFVPSPDGFLGLPDEDGFTPEDARAWVIPFGFEASVSYGGGTERGPAAALEASHQVELFDEVFWREPVLEYGVATMAQPALPQKIEDALDLLDSLVDLALDNGKFPLVIGGEHSITAGAIRPFARRHEKLTILHFDAHADLRDGYEDEHYSHAAALRRCLDHENIDLVSVGIRNISVEEIPFLEASRERITIFWAKDMRSWSIDGIANVLKGKNVYVSFDVDGFDSSLMPATGTPEPGGMDWHTVMDILAAASKHANIVGADVVELAPSPGLHACDFLTAKLCYKILSYALLAER